jgi:SNF2 family DNA or RNA helicase
MCEHNSKTEFSRACEFFRLSPASALRSDFAFNLKATKTGLALHQLLAIHWQTLLDQSKRSYGGFVGDEMGLGKTREMFALLLLKRELNVALQEVAEARKNNDYSVHLPIDTTEGECKAEKERRFSFICPCIRDSPTAEFEPIRGPSLILTPAGVVGSFEDQWLDMVKTPRDQRLIVNLKVLHGKEELSESDLDKLKAEFKSGVFDDGKREFREDVASIDHREEVPQDDQDQTILLTTKETFQARFLTPGKCLIGKKMKWFIAPKNKGYRQHEFVPQISFGHILVDEVHKAKSETTTPVKLCYFYPYARRWLYSGTLMESDIGTDLGSYLRALAHTHDNWSSDSELGQLYSTKLARVIQLHSRAVKGSATRDEIQDLMERLKPSLPAIIIRRTLDSVLVKQSKLVSIGTLKVQDIETHRPKVEYQRELLALKQAVIDNAAGIQTMKWGTFFQYAWKLRVSTTFPHVAKMINANCVDGTTAQIQENGWYRDKLSDISNPYFD